MRDPDLQGRAAKAWKSRAESDLPDHQANIASYVVNGAFHPFWSWWVVAAISLRDIPGVPPANKQYPGAEYELMIVSLDPECCPPDPDTSEGLKFLTPIDLQFHFDGVDEDQAAEITELAVQAIVEGKLSPDQDYREAWRKVLTTTVDHYKQGKH